MKATVKEIFEDINGIYHQVGEIIDVDSNRLKNLEKKGLVEAVAEKPKATSRKVVNDDRPRKSGS